MNELINKEVTVAFAAGGVNAVRGEVTRFFHGPDRIHVHGHIIGTNTTSELFVIPLTGIAHIRVHAED